jgi:hypothetical protein
MSKLVNIGGHGLGDCILSLQISHLLKERNIEHVNLISTRNEVFEPLNYIFGNKFKLIQIEEKYAHENAIIDNIDFQKDIKTKYGSDDITYNVPDLLFKNPLGLNYKKYGLEPSVIKQTRVYTDNSTQKEDIIYCGLCSTTEGYIYENIPLLLIRLAEFLPSYTIYFPMVNKWDKEINNLGNFDLSFPSNVFVDKNPSFIDSLKWLEKSSYGIFTCNGPSHLAYQLGIPRLVLDPQFNKIPWIARWKEDYNDCIPINIDINNIAQLVSANINTPQTKMVDSKIILNLIQQNQANWKDIFYFKYA